MGEMLTQTRNSLLTTTPYTLPVWVVLSSIATLHIRVILSSKSRC